MAPLAKQLSYVVLTTNSPSETFFLFRRSRSLIAIEEEHDRLLKSLLDNRTRLNQLLNSSNP